MNKLAKVLGKRYDWGILWMVTGGFGSVFVIAFILLLLGFEDDVFGLVIAIIYFGPIILLQGISKILYRKNKINA